MIESLPFPIRDSGTQYMWMTVSDATVNTPYLLATDPSHQQGWGVSLQGDIQTVGGHPCRRSEAANARPQALETSSLPF